ncbi:MAG: AAA family ATPase [Planctomycetaceae bacterium]|nr:AAA family ATPase [Planctomycetaceae bacterium]MCB9923077.1 AAA family ATPase [Planctomycetaceae bacterium]
MQLSHQLAEYVRACFAGVWIESQEHEDAILEIAQLCHREAWMFAQWDIEQGLRTTCKLGDASVSDPLSAVRVANDISDPDTVCVLVLTNMHRFLGSVEIVQALARQVHLGKQHRATLVILSPVIQLPPELEKLFVVLQHELPDRSQLEDIARSIATEETELPSADELSRVLESAAGLTRYEAENAFSLSLVRHGCLHADVVNDLKAQTLKKSGLVGLHSGTERFDQLGGLDNLKAFCLRAVRRQGTRSTRLRPRGVLLLSPPGCGKSQFAKALGNETGRPTLTLDIGRLMGSLVGESEGNIRRALRIADAMAPCVLFCDELDKGLSGVGGSSQADSGVSSRLFGNFLTWLSDRESDVFVVATANDISKLPPEFARAERFDSVFFIDLPDADQRQVIWQIYSEQFGLDEQPLPKDDLWTGAEIRACCRLAALLDVPLIQAANNIVPVAVTARESVERLRSWADGRCLSADNTGVYHASQSTGKSRVRRKLPRNPSVN